MNTVACIVIGICSLPGWIAPYAAPFQRELSSYGIVEQSLTSIRFVKAPLGPLVYADCVKGIPHEVRPMIRVNTLYWEKLSDEQREVVVTHELGHCYLNLPHGDGVMNERPLEAL